MSNWERYITEREYVVLTDCLLHWYISGLTTNQLGMFFYHPSILILGMVSYWVYGNLIYPLERNKHNNYLQKAIVWKHMEAAILGCNYSTPWKTSMEVKLTIWVNNAWYIDLEPKRAPYARTGESWQLGLYHSITTMHPDMPMLPGSCQYK